MSLDAYRTAQLRLSDPREAEYLAFSEVTRRLLELVDDPRTDLQRLASAVHANKMLWGVLADDCASVHNQLPKQARAAIIDLSAWVDRHSSDVIRKGADLSPLIEINRSMMEGLSGRSPAR